MKISNLYQYLLIIKRLFYGFCNRFFTINILEKRQLLYNSNHNSFTNKDDLLESGQDYNLCLETTGIDYLYSGEI